MPDAQTPTQMLAEQILGRSLADYVAEKRAQERPRWSWQNIADQLHEDTGRKVTVAAETLRLWYSDRSEAVAS